MGSEAFKLPDQRIEQFRSEFLIPYINMNRRALSQELRKLEESLNKEMEKPENVDYLPGVFLQAVFDQEAFQLLLEEETRFAQKKMPEGKSWGELEPEEIATLISEFPDEKEILQRLDSSIEKYRKVVDEYWSLDLGYNTRIETTDAKISLADLLYRKAVSLENKEEQQQLMEEADTHYLEVMDSSLLAGGLKDELRLIYLLRKIHERFSPDTDFFVEHGTPREDLGEEKTDLKIYLGNYQQKVQLKVLTPNDYVAEFNEALLARARKKAVPGTEVLHLDTATLREAFKKLTKPKAKKLIMQLVGSMVLESEAVAFREAMIPQKEKKAIGELHLDLRSLDKTVEQFANVAFLKKFDLPVSTIPEILASKKAFKEALTGLIKKGGLKLKKNDLGNLSGDLIEKIKKELK